jgi:hypothetical protein
LVPGRSERAQSGDWRAGSTAMTILRRLLRDEDNRHVLERNSVKRRSSFALNLLHSVSRTIARRKPSEEQILVVQASSF